MPCVAKLAPLRKECLRPSAHWYARPASRTSALAVVCIAALVSVGIARAAGQSGSTSGLGGGSAVVSACGSGITQSYTETYASSIPGYSVNQVTLANIPIGCLGKAYRIQLTGAAGAAVGSEMTGRLPASGTVANVPTLGNVDASLVAGISVVIS
jgi:hypothetical protein